MNEMSKTEFKEWKKQVIVFVIVGILVVILLFILSKISEPISTPYPQDNFIHHPQPFPTKRFA